MNEIRECSVCHYPFKIRTVFEREHILMCKSCSLCLISHKGFPVMLKKKEVGEDEGKFDWEGSES